MDLKTLISNEINEKVEKKMENFDVEDFARFSLKAHLLQGGLNEALDGVITDFEDRLTKLERE